MDLNAAYRVSKLMSLGKLFRDHSAGKIDGALLSDGIRALADAEFPNDKQAVAKYVKVHATEFAEKLRDDYERQQKGGYGDALGVPTYQGATGSGTGTSSAARGGNYYSGSAANAQ